MVDAAKLDGALARALTAFMQHENLEIAFRDLLTSLMEVTASEYAFVGAFRESGAQFRVDALAWCGADWHPTEDEPALPLVTPTLLDEVRSRAQPVVVSVGEGIPRPVGFPPGAPQVQLAGVATGRVDERWRLSNTRRISSKLRPHTIG